MLNLDQSNEFRRFSQLDIFFGMPANVTIIGTFVPFQDEVTLYHTHFGILDGLIPNKGALSTGVTQGKTSIKEGIAKVMGLVCGKTKVFAMKTGNTVLEAAVNVTENEILHKKEADILSFVINTNAAITPFLANVLFTPYGITAATLATQLTNANSYNSLIGAAGVVITTDKIANKNINAAIKVLQTDLKTFDLLIDDFETTYPNFVEGYHSNAKVQHVGVHHSGIEGTVTDKVTGAVIFGATIRIIGLTKSGTTSLLGKYLISPVAPKDYQVQVSAPGYVTITVVQHVFSGVIGVLDFVMTAL